MRTCKSSIYALRRFGAASWFPVGRALSAVPVFSRGFGSSMAGSAGDAGRGSDSTGVLGGMAAGIVAGTAAVSLSLCEDADSAERAVTGDPEVDWANSRKPWRVVFVLGGPGAGKGTYCARIRDEYGFVHLSAGDLLRAERDSGSETGEMIQRYISEGNIVPVEVTVGLLKAAMEKSGATRFLVDGFPRNEDNLMGWQKIMDPLADVEFVLFYDTDDETRLGRLLKRAETSGRTDDKKDVIMKRFKVFREQTMPIVQYYEKQDKVRMVDGQPAPEVVFTSTQEAIEPVISGQVLEASIRLLQAAHGGDWDTYSRLVDGSLITLDQEETFGLPVRGTQFHKKYFDAMEAAGEQGSVPQDEESAPLSSPGSTCFRLLDPSVRILGKGSAAVSYVRLVTPREQGEVGGDGEASAAPIKPKAFSETRIWQEIDGAWRCVHLHKSPLRSLAVTEEEAELASLQAAVRSARWAAESALEQLKAEDERVEADDAKGRQ